MVRLLNGEKKKTNPTTKFICEVRLFDLVMSHNLLSVSHRNIVCLRRAQFLYAFMTNVSIDLPSVICNSFITMYHAKDVTVSLIPQCVIIRILTHLNMTFPAAIMLVYRFVQPINGHSVTRITTHMQKQKKRTRETENDGEDDETGPISLTDVTAELKIVVSYLDCIIFQLNEQDIVSGNLKTRMRYLEQWAKNSSSGVAFAPFVTSTDGTEPDAVVEGD